MSSANRSWCLAVSLLLVSPAAAQVADPAAGEGPRATEPPASIHVDATPNGVRPLHETPATDLDLVRFTLFLENDKFVGTDRFYTNGFKLALQSTDLGPVSRAVSRLLSVIPILDARPLDWGLTVGQEIYTPEDVSQPLLIPNDRPYGAWLYGGVFLTRGNRPGPGEAAPRVLFEEQIVLQLGALGESGQGEAVQNNWHKVLRVEESKGWDNQLGSEVGVQLYYGRKFLFQALGTSDGLGADLLPHIGIAAGSVFTFAALGVTVRLGWNAGRGFGPAQRIASAGLDAVAAQEGLTVYAFARLEGRAVLWNAFIDGTLVRDARYRPSVNGIVERVDVTREIFVADLDLGIMFAWGPFAVTFTAIRRTREFEEQEDSFRFGVIHVQLTF